MSIQLRSFFSQPARLSVPSVGYFPPSVSGRAESEGRRRLRSKLCILSPPPPLATVVQLLSIGRTNSVHVVCSRTTVVCICSCCCTSTECAEYLLSYCVRKSGWNKWMWTEKK